MRSLLVRRRLLPLTLAVMALLFTEKAVNLGCYLFNRSSTQAVAAELKSVTTDSAPAPSRPAATSSTGSTASASEIRLLQELRRRRAALDDREQSLNQKSQILQAAEHKLQSKLEELTALQERLERAEAARKQHESASWTGLVKTYEDMKPRDAAAIFDILDMNVLLEVLDRMDERKEAAVLAAMAPERARLATQLLVQKHNRADALAAGAGDSSATAIARTNDNG